MIEEYPRVSIAPDKTIGVGDLAQDVVTGMRGIVTALHFYLNGCVRVSLQQKETTKDGVPGEHINFDVEQLRVLLENAHFEDMKEAGLDIPQRTGGPRDNDDGRPGVHG